LNTAPNYNKIIDTGPLQMICTVTFANAGQRIGDAISVVSIAATTTQNI
jgi:hypothetical protein